jgi:putative nucleotidyltransferase with HDIG domain
MEAPGTYHHSVMVGNLAETAAEEIGADSVLVRVGALYHDIGKLKRPYFFIENQFSRENPHDRIAPSLSALILTSHTKDGLEMAKQHNLPESLQQIILQHHGDSLASFFYNKALEENPDISEEIFRYSGPNPQTKEAALVMLADGVEAAVRASSGANPGKIEGIVRKIINDKLNKGHLGQCDLTFRDLDKIATAFVKVLSGIYHTRIVYPDMPPARKALKEPPKEAAKPKETEED